MEVNILLFDDFDTMDAFGPAEAVSYTHLCRP